MSQLSQTILAAAILLVLCMLGLGVGWLLSGKNRLGKRCGYRPKDPSKQSTCEFCGKKDRCKERDIENNRDTHAT
jgi:hypothetical protein